MRLCSSVVSEPSPSLGGHLKTGHTWPLQNRPTKLSQDKSICTAPEVVAAIFLKRNVAHWVYTGDTWAEGTATQGCDRSADPGAGIWEGESPFQLALLTGNPGPKAINPGSARAAPSQ